MSKPENQNDAIRAEMEQMSTASLEKMLLDDYNSSGHGETDMDELYMAAQILEERGLGLCNSVDQAWERFRKKYLPFATMLIEDGETPSSDDAQGRRHSLLPKWKTHVVLVTAALCALLLSISAAAATNGIDVLKMLTQWTDEQFWLAPGQIDPASRDEIHIPEKNKEYASLQEAVEDCGLTPVADTHLTLPTNRLV